MPTDPIAGLLNQLAYKAYANNRSAHPKLSVDYWRFTYGGDVEWMEPKYQAEVNAYAEDGIRRAQQERLEGRASDFGITPWGQTIKAGR